MLAVREQRFCANFHLVLDLPCSRWAHAACSLGKRMLVHGGIGSSLLDDVALLDGEVMSWRVVSTYAANAKDKPEKCMSHAAATIGIVAWFFGGA